MMIQFTAPNGSPVWERADAIEGIADAPMNEFGEPHGALHAASELRMTSGRTQWVRETPGEVLARMGRGEDGK